MMTMDEPLRRRLRRVLFVLVLFACQPVKAEPESAISFTWDDYGAAVVVRDRPANEVLETIAAMTGITVVPDPSDTSRLDGVYRKRTLDALLLDLAPGMVIEYRYDERVGDHVIDRVVTSAMADPQAKQEQLRALVIAREQLAERTPRPDRPVRYTGIGATLRPARDGSGVFVDPITSQAPAAQAGLALGDLVTAVDGRPVGDFADLNEVAAAIRGPENSEVRLTVRHPDGTVRERTVRRALVQWQPDLTQ
jgi:C-terminal processing protease CtpA/Prc